MTARFLGILSSTVASLWCALALGDPLFYLLSFTLILCTVFALVSVVLAQKSLRVTQAVVPDAVDRGGKGELQVSFSYKSPLPTAPFEAHISILGETAVFFIRAKSRVMLPFNLRHVGQFHVGINRIYCKDIFGLFRLSIKTLPEKCAILSLPQLFTIDQLTFSPRDDGEAMLNRSGEDVTSPEDTRAYRQGDALKRVHWKLSARTGDLIVRRFEVPMPPETLILINDEPLKIGGESELSLRDAICETALSSAKEQLALEAPVRIPFYTNPVRDFFASHESELSNLKRELAMIAFDSEHPFEAAVSLEMRRARTTGAAIIITPVLSGALVEAAKNLRLSGPDVRLYFVSHDPENEEYLPYVRRLQNAMIEVCYVSPV